MVESNILYEDNHLLACNKPAGVLSQGDSSERTSFNEVAKRYLKEKYQKPGNVFLGIVHRLDFLVSGAIVYARTSKGASRLSEQIRQRSFEKVYLAITEVKDEQALSQGSWRLLEQELIRVDNTTLVTKQKDARSVTARLHYKTLKIDHNLALHQVKLETGRKHQIRCQLASAGLPIIGDRKYGASNKYKVPQETILLHSTSLGFKHPTTKEKILITAQIPNYFQEFILFDDLSLLQ